MTSKQQDEDEQAYWSDSLVLFTEEQECKDVTNFGRVALCHKYNHTRTMLCGSQFKFGYWTLEYACHFAGTSIITVGDDAYIKARCETAR